MPLNSTEVRGVAETLIEERGPTNARAWAEHCATRDRSGFWPAVVREIDNLKVSRPVYEIEHLSDGWWTVMRNYRRESFATEAEAEAAIHSYELEDYEAEQEAREQGKI